jgi:citrate synthase
MFYYEIFPYPVLNLAERAEEQSIAMLALQKELDNAREESQRARERESRRVQQDEEELQILRESCERLEEERASTVRLVTSIFIADHLTLP